MTTFDFRIDNEEPEQSHRRGKWPPITGLARQVPRRLAISGHDWRYVEKIIKDKKIMNKKPASNVCPQKYCFFWRETNDKKTIPDIERCCTCPFGICKRISLDNGNQDWYEPCEPELKKDGLPWFYFINSVEDVSFESREKYLRDSKDYWNCE